MKINLNVTPCYLNRNSDDKKVVIFPKGLQGPAQFTDELVHKKMEELGILVPLEKRTHFSDKKVIYLSDTDFGKAFQEICCNDEYPTPKAYRWKILS